MAYSAWSVVAGEQPTTSKWNILGTNDSSFNDGTGIGSAVITNGKLASTAVNSSVVDWTTSGNIWWQEMTRTTLGSTSSTLTATFTAKKYLRVHAFLINNGSSLTTNASLTFNSDTAANYAYLTASNLVSPGAVNSSKNNIVLEANTGIWNHWLTIDIINVAAQEKAVISNTHATGTGAAAAPGSTQVFGKWVNTAAQITSLTLTNGGTGTYAVGTEVVVLGHD